MSSAWMSGSTMFWMLILTVNFSKLSPQQAPHTKKKAKKYKQLPGSRRLGCSGVVLIKKQVGSATLPLGIVLTVYFTTRQAQANMTPRLWGTPPPDYHYSQYCTT
ncbi:hypothetical protein ABBQ32_011642 [Trebouxia sp. C0010 RCD-2024]